MATATVMATGVARGKWYTDESLRHKGRTHPERELQRRATTPTPEPPHNKIESYALTPEGRLFKAVNIPYVGRDKIYVGHWRFTLAKDIKVVDTSGHEIGVESILGVGYVSRADVLVKNGRVVKIRVIDIEQ